MSQLHAWTPEEDKIILTNCAAKSYSQIGEMLGLTKHQVRNRHTRLNQWFFDWLKDRNESEVEGGNVVTHEVTESGTVVTTASSTIRTLEAAIQAAKIDMDIWEVERHVVNKWDGFARTRSWEFAPKDWRRKLTAVELWQVKVWFRRKSVSRQESAVDMLAERLKRSIPRVPVIHRTVRRAGVRDACMLEVSAPDIHMGKYAWGQETGTDYDLKIAQRDYRNVIEQLIAHADHYPVDHVLFPLGNDLLHTDNTEGSTTRGTRQDVDGRWKKVYVDTCDLMAWAIQRLRAVAPVTVKVVPGNHDEMTSFCVGHAIECVFRGCKDVVVDNSPPTRKYMSYGVNLIGFAHGDVVRGGSFPLLMAQEMPKQWATATHKEWHLGHLHKKSEDRYNAGDTHMGVVVRVIPSLSGTDAWHAKNGYVKNARAAEAYIWGKHKGYIGHFSATPPCV